MNSRRCMFDMGLSHPVQPVSRTLSLARRDRLVLGADLKRSESSPAAERWIQFKGLKTE
jgi:hypothetical protein